MTHHLPRRLVTLVATPVAALSLLVPLAVTAPSAAASTESGTPSTTRAMSGSADNSAQPPMGEQNADDRYQPAACQSLTAAQRRSDKPYAQCFALGYTGPDGELMARPTAAGPPATALGPADIQDAYDLPDAGEGMTVAVVDAFGYEEAESDLAVFRSHYGLPPCTTENGCFTKVDQRGGTDYPPVDLGWTVETALDLDAVSAACPKCNILLVQADTNAFEDLGKAVDTAAQMGAVAISNSYGHDGEDPNEQAYDHYYEHPGIAVVVASGDTGNVQSWPSTNPTVVAVGGTHLTRDDSERGWHETAWDGTGSGCSLYEPRPDYQIGIDTTCGDFSATADIAADADSATGLAVYNTAALSGWSQWGGTSLAAPLVAGMYALAGPPTPGTYPVSYPYQAAPAHLHDVTEGTNGRCGNVLCEAGPGWDGPTGVGTPAGIAALTQGETGTIAGTATNADTGEPLAGVTVQATDEDGNVFHATTEDDGGYDLPLPVGTYDLTATLFGYDTSTVEDVQVDADEQVTEDFAMAPLPTRTISGEVTDGAGHGWPMRAKITIDDYPGGVIYSDPYTGRYSVTLPTGRSYTMHVTSADLPGYAEQDLTVDLTDDESGVVHRDIALSTLDTCTAPGYSYQYDGATEAFTGWEGTTAQDGWSVVDNAGNGQTWSFDNPGDRQPPEGGDEDFAVVDSDAYGDDGVQDTSLVSPVIDLSGQDHPRLLADTLYVWFPDETATVDLSVDGGTTWKTVQSLDLATDHHLNIPLPDAAGKSQVQVRFHFTGSSSRRWELDNVFIGTRACQPVAGGLVAGAVTDRYTGDPVVGATVTSAADESEFGVSTATPDDVDLPDGYYWLFSSHTGPVGFTATGGHYAPTQEDVDVRPDTVQHRDIALRAGHLIVDKTAVSVTQRLGRSTSRTIALTNDGTAPIHVSLGETDAGFTPMNEKSNSSATGAPTKVVSVHTSVAAKPKGLIAADSPKAHGGPTLRQPGPAGQMWTGIADYPTAVMDNAVASHDGKVYVVGGSNGSYTLAAGNVYDPQSQSWQEIAPLPEPLNGASAEFVGDTLYVVGGWERFGDVSNQTYAYHPDTDTWTRMADMPAGVAMAGTAVLGNTLYVVGGCTTNHCSPYSDAVYSFDPGTNTWKQEPDYPTGAAYVACGGVEWQVVCTGGTHGSSLNATYGLIPGTDAWMPKADLPVDAWGAAAASANGKLVVIGGAINNGSAVTNQVFAYNPDNDTWAALANANNAVYRGGAACGVYKVGGSAGGFHAVPYAEMLPGMSQCSHAVTWLRAGTTSLDLQPGEKADVRVTMDSSVLAQPGSYRAEITVATDSPYRVSPVDVTMQVDPPRRWGKVAGTVTDEAGSPIGGATIAICTMYRRGSGMCGPVTYTLKTDARGHYQLWLDKGFNPLQIIAAKAGYIPRMRIARVHKGGAITVNFKLKETDLFTASKVEHYLRKHLHPRRADS